MGRDYGNYICRENETDTFGAGNEPEEICGVFAGISLSYCNMGTGATAAGVYVILFVRHA